MIVDNFHDITTAKPVFWNVASENSVSVKFERHRKLSFWN